eukprot:TRINITY_DN13602_c0_g1_i11.p1 TRINITY_DN13602_c0_g1~~TRINITY_DN13602_c0_g1_i11.p1  ORF type:complete len:252 (+),score=40.21 TRINITY_DN13602_c0_g1_i11:324-1079(+)
MLYDQYEKTKFKLISDVAKQIETDRGVCELWTMQQSLMEESVDETFEKNFGLIKNPMETKLMGSRGLLTSRTSDEVVEIKQIIFQEISSPKESPVQMLLREFRSAYDSLEIERAYRLAHEIEVLLPQASLSFTEHTQYELCSRKVKNVYAKFQKAMALSRDSKGFHEERLNEVTVVGWRKDPDSFLTLRLDTTIEGDLLPLTTVVKETLLFSQLLSYVNETSVVRSILIVLHEALLSINTLTEAIESLCWE